MPGSFPAPPPSHGKDPGNEVGNQILKAKTKKKASSQGRGLHTPATSPPAISAPIYVTRVSGEVL